MPRCSPAITIIVFFLSSTISFSQSSSPGPDNDINLIIEETSIESELERSISEIESQFSQNPFGLPTSKNEQMMKLFAENFEPETMGSSIRQTFQEQYNEAHAQATIDWLSDSTTQMALNYEKEFYTLQGIRKRVVNKYELEQSPAAPERTELLSSLIENMSAAEMEIESRAIIFRAMISALSKLSSQRSFSESQIDTFVQNFRNQLQAQIDQQLTNRFLVKYHGLDSAPLQQYMMFYDTEAGHWLNDTTAQAVHTALENASAEFLSSLNAIQ